MEGEHDIDIFVLLHIATDIISIIHISLILLTTL